VRRLHRYICLWGALERKLGKSLKPTKKAIGKIEGKGQALTIKEATTYI
jgi:hypothetical protein